uniref:Uncharacterized protein n=1 Tax=Cacopsylla melanoneura TaxID=428564 RepID=A0A8D9A1G5_9HEMI
MLDIHGTLNKKVITVFIVCTYFIGQVCHLFATLKKRSFYSKLVFPTFIKLEPHRHFKCSPTSALYCHPVMRNHPQGQKENPVGGFRQITLKFNELFTRTLLFRKYAEGLFCSLALCRQIE